MTRAAAPTHLVTRPYPFEFNAYGMIIVSYIDSQHLYRALNVVVNAPGLILGNRQGERRATGMNGRSVVE